MTLSELEQRVLRGEDVLLTLRQVAEVTGTPYSTVRAWKYRYKVLPFEPVGPSFAPRVRGAVIVKLFCRQSSPCP